MATMAMSARISAYSARPWPSSSERSEASSVRDKGHERTSRDESVAPHEWRRTEPYAHSPAASQWDDGHGTAGSVPARSSPHRPPCAASTRTPIRSASGPPKKTRIATRQQARPARAPATSRGCPGPAPRASGPPVMRHAGVRSGSARQRDDQADLAAAREDLHGRARWTRPARRCPAALAAGSDDDRRRLGRGLGRIAGVVAILDHLLDRVRDVARWAPRAAGPPVEPDRRARWADRRASSSSVQSRRRRIRSGASGEVGGERLVQDPEDRALHVHRQAPVVAEGLELHRARAPAARGPGPPARSVGTRPRSSSTIGRTSKMKLLVASSVCWTIDTSRRSSPLAGRDPGPGAAPRSAPGARCWSATAPARRASRGRSPGAGPPGR